MQPTGGVEDKDLEQRLAEGEARRAHRRLPSVLGQSADEQIQIFQRIRPVAVHGFQGCQPLRVAGQVLERADGVQAELAAQLVVARDTPLAGAQDVHGAEIEHGVPGMLSACMKRG